MSYQVKIQPSGHEFTVKADEPLLTAALNAGFALPYGCRNGACGSCKGKVLSGEVDYGVHQEDTLTAEDKAKGLALFCRATARSDLSIEVKEVGAVKDIQVKNLPCRIERMEKLAPDVMSVWLKLPSNERLQFLPGQYIDFLLKDGARRSFSLANTPEEDALLELHIRHVDGGRFTDHVFNTMKLKDIMRISGPYGSFFLRESDKPVIFLAGGTGFAPIKSILGHAFHHELDRPCVLYWGVRGLADLYQPLVPSGWQQRQKNFSFIPVLSAPAATDDWPGRTGYVHEAVLADFADLSGYEVYACGAPAMVEAARTGFLQRGLPEDAFFADSFDFQSTP
ncbi:MAG TPA: CDP-6-deoxy-delta-3,4-glucoseen reductase [Thiobacillaceae bacterium]|nr:CDP-6-deoxy-delta-3,4-glucoseen reductase [Thiobacillaceae bacterium]HNU64872.1 CDP-6-deoxy-delta-3,4-glucoseen reductase [Thiobacillaceae bacterium]